MKIGNIELRNNLILAPMAGVTDLPFRLIAVENGCGLVVSEMVSAKGLVMGGDKSFDLLVSSPEERPCAVQLFGSEAGIMAEAAARVEAAGADILDINMGCPVKKVVKDGSGSALLKDLGAIESILKAVRDKIKCSLTIKIRSGWDSSSLVACEVLKVAEASGVDAITLHPRTRNQGFGGKADWSLIGKVKEKAKIPIIGNGDVRTPEEARGMLRSTGCDGVMIGRGAMGNPWLFGQTISYMESGGYELPAAADKRRVVLKHLGLMVTRYGSKRAVRAFRKHLSCYSRGMVGSSLFRGKINGTDLAGEVEELISDFFADEYEYQGRYADLEREEPLMNMI